jgi:ABC-2 type transport system permease protein
MTAWLRLARAFLRRDLQVARSYRIAFISQAVGTILFLAAFAVVTPIVSDDFSSRYGAGYTAYAAVGIAVTGTLLSALQTFAESIREAQLDGTLEVVLMTPASRPSVIAAMGAFPVLAGLVSTALTLILAAVATGDFSIAPLSLVLAALASIAAFSALGLLAGAAMLVVKRGNPVASIVGLLGAIAGGAYAPVDTFPGWLQRIADINPITYALDAWRGALLEGRGPGSIADSLLVLVAIAVAITPLAWHALGKALDLARTDGTLATY